MTRPLSAHALYSVARALRLKGWSFRLQNKVICECVLSITFFWHTCAKQMFKLVPLVISNFPPSSSYESPEGTLASEAQLN